MDPDLCRRLSDYRSFRHVERHAYGYELRWDKMQPLVDGLPLVARELIEALELFRRTMSRVESSLSG